MWSPAAAIAWQLGRRHRWGFAAAALYLASLGAVRVVTGGVAGPGLFAEDWQLPLLIVLPLSATMIYFVAVFSFGLDGDLAGRRSLYPARMLTLPLRSHALAGWPMLYGAAAAATCWLATRRLALWPAGVHVPEIWPALLAAALVAWAQALTWMPYARRGMRVVATLLLMISIDLVIFPALERQASEAVMVGLLAPFLPSAYLVACLAVSRARRGEVPATGRLGWWLGIGAAGRRGQRRFASAGRAQAWLEWRQHGRSLPVLVAILLPFELALLFAFSTSQLLVLETLVAVLLTPPFMATFVSATVSRPTPAGRDAGGVSTFLATRPLTSGSLLAAKLAATIRSTLAAWLLIALALPLALWLSATAPMVADLGRRLAGALGTPRAVTLGLLALAALLAATWSQLLLSLAVGMSGRPWLVKASVFAPLALLTVLVPYAVAMVGDRAAMATAWGALPWLLAVIVGLKLATAAWVAIRLHDRGLMRGRSLVLGALVWDATVLALYGLLLWLLPTVLFPRHLLALAAIAVIPLVRLAAAPLALDWNRHR